MSAACLGASVGHAGSEQKVSMDNMEAVLQMRVTVFPVAIAAHYGNTCSRDMGGSGIAAAAHGSAAAGADVLMIGEDEQAEVEAAAQEQVLMQAQGQPDMAGSLRITVSMQPYTVQPHHRMWVHVMACGKDVAMEAMHVSRADASTPTICPQAGDSIPTTAALEDLIGKEKQPSQAVVQMHVDLDAACSIVQRPCMAAVEVSESSTVLAGWSPLLVMPSQAMADEVNSFVLQYGHER